MKPSLVALCLLPLVSCTAMKRETRFVGTWKMRDVSPIDYYLRIYPDGWVAQWPNPAETTAWARLCGETLAWGYQAPLHDPTLSLCGSLLVMRDNVSDKVFDRLSDEVEPPK